MFFRNIQFRKVAELSTPAVHILRWYMDFFLLNSNGQGCKFGDLYYKQNYIPVQGMPPSYQGLSNRREYSEEGAEQKLTSGK